ncbi:alpha/beta fold hydrolase [Arthrobacter terrae]|uniref:alpha/beta fold hydrolase n=1 Tax=Arthrobacter terrae TaxID=2935737 RepID=UPI0028ACA3CA|nr:alpha/beta hydrolase [Arthrobacter terrae]
MSIPKITATLLGAGNPLPATAKPLLIVGAGLGTGVRALWGAAVPYLEGFEVVGVDLPGHGASPAATEAFSVAELASGVRDIAAQLCDGADRKVYYAGVSLAGGVALQLALDQGTGHEGVFSAVAAICSSAQFGEPQGWLDRAETVRVQGTPTQVVGSAQRWFAPGFMEAYPDRAAALLHSLQDADRFSYAFACRALADFDVRDRLGAIEAPLLAIAGELDPICPPAVAETIGSGVRNGRSAVVPGAAHQAPLEAPEETAALLRGFFA